MVKVEIEKPVVPTIAISIDEDSARKLMRYLVDGPDWLTARGGKVAEELFTALENAGIEEA